MTLKVIFLKRKRILRSGQWEGQGRRILLILNYLTGGTLLHGGRIDTHENCVDLGNGQVWLSLYIN